MGEHEIAATVNALRDIAIQYRDAQQLRARIARLIVPLLRRADGQRAASAKGGKDAD